MMLTLVRVEMRKILGQRWMAVLLFWIWPVGGIVLPLAIMVLTLINPPNSQQAITPVFPWTETALSAWLIPTNLLGRLLFITLASSIFASEYQWGTWKNIVPRADRVRLALAKYIAFTLLMMISIAATSILLTIGTGLIQAARGLPYPPDVTPDALGAFIRDYALEAVLTLVNTLIGVAFGAILAMATRSILGGVLGGLLLVTGEWGFISGVTTLGYVLQLPQIAGLVRFSSMFNIGNIQIWMRSGQPLTIIPDAPTNSLAASFVVLAVWMLGLVAINLWLFQRQDLS